MNYLTEQQIDQLSSETGAALRAETKVRLTISPDNLGGYWEGGINGHFFRVKTGVEVELPQSLAALIAQSARVRVENEQKVSAYRGRGKKVG